MSEKKSSNPGAGIMERFRSSKVALRWGILALIAMAVFILATAL